jgi:hypothetical protein
LDKENTIVVRISGEGQYKIDSNLRNQIDEIDNSIVEIIEKMDPTNSSQGSNQNQNQAILREKMDQIVNLVTSQGIQLDDKEITESDIIIPSRDISIEEAKKIFKGEGIVKDEIA